MNLLFRLFGAWSLFLVVCTAWQEAHMPSFMVDPLTVTTIALLVLGAISGLTYSEKRSRFMRLSQIVGMSISACVQVLIFLYLAHAFFFPDIIVDPFPPSLHSSVSQPR